jgi:hypothetical protein
MQALFAILIVLAVIALLVALVLLDYFRSRTILRHWARDKGYTILASEYRSAPEDTPWHVTVRTPDGDIRRGLVRCGSPFWGVWKDEAAVIRWDEESE